MPKRQKIRMMGSTYAPSVKAAAELVLALQGQEPQPPAPVAMPDVGQVPQPTLQPARKAG